MIIETALIISFSTWLGNKIANKGFDSVYSKLTKESEFDKTFNLCIETVANDLEEKYPEILGNSISYFLSQEDVFDELCKLLFVNQDVNKEIILETFDESTLPHNFVLELINKLKIELASQPIFQELLADKELFIAVKGISKDVRELSENSSLTLNEIKKIKNILKQRFKTQFNIDDFLKVYRKNLVNNLGTLNFIGLGIDPSIKKGKRKELDKIFIEPLLKIKCEHHLKNERKDKVEYFTEVDDFGEENIITYKHLFDRPYNFVVLGNPGSGKSLLIKSIICSIANQDKNTFSNNQIIKNIPFIVELKKYLAYKNENGGNIIKYLSNSIEEEFSVSSILEENLLTIFNTQKTIIFFDGLDEIFSVTDKLQIKNDIENFHNLFPNTRSVTTSRFIGYNEAKLDETKFCELKIKSFNDKQIKKYVKKWYDLEEDDIDIRNSEIKSFLSKKDNIDDELLSNPLLLSLIVILFRNNLKIPESKLEIYQSCTNTLVDKWDASKNLDIKIESSILQKKEPIFSDLAFWQYELLSSKNTKITYRMAKDTVAKSLIKKNVADEFNDVKLAESFLDYAQKRSIYFDNNFTHKTFLEYYSAYWIYSNIEKKHKTKERDKIIRKYISNPFWFIVLELLLNMIDKDQPDTEIIDSIFKKQMSNKSLSFLIYILPNIINISKEESINTYSVAIEYLTLTNRIDKNRKLVFDRIIKNLSSKEQMQFLEKALSKINDSNKNNNFYYLVNELFFSPRCSSDNVIINEILRTPEYEVLIRKDSYLYQLYYSYIYLRGRNDNKFSLEYYLEFIRLFGANEMFKMHQSKYDNFGIGAYIGYYFHIQLNEENIITIQDNLRILEDNSISYSSMLRFIIGNMLYFNPNINSLNFLCHKIEEKETSDKEKLFFIIFIIKGLSSRFMYRRDVKISIDDLSINNKYKQLIKMVARSSIRSNIVKIFYELGLQDKKLLQLTKAIRNTGDVE